MSVTAIAGSHSDTPKPTNRGTGVGSSFSSDISLLQKKLL